MNKEKRFQVTTYADKFQFLWARHSFYRLTTKIFDISKKGTFPPASLIMCVNFPVTTLHNVYHHVVFIGS